MSLNELSFASARPAPQPCMSALVAQGIQESCFGFLLSKQTHLSCNPPPCHLCQQTPPCILHKNSLGKSLQDGQSMLTTDRSSADTWTGVSQLDTLDEQKQNTKLSRAGVHRKLYTPQSKLFKPFKPQQLMECKLLLSIYSQLCVEQYGEIGRWSLVGVKVCLTTNSHNTFIHFVQGRLGESSRFNKKSQTWLKWKLLRSTLYYGLLKKFHFLTLFKFKFNGSERVNKIQKLENLKTRDCSPESLFGCLPKGHVTYPPLNLIPDTLWIPETEREGKNK